MFHGYVCCRCWWSLARLRRVEEVEAALAGDHIDVVNGESRSSEQFERSGPGRHYGAGEGRLGRRSEEGLRMWIWLAADLI